mmetsp:Transcript_5518/g.7596  ORF Transcript_5518/g.7596 Transcript_5518/m.7596 type:complete len:553 (-) Transcript_5518:736-2394(-)
MNAERKYVLLITACFQNVLCAGVLFGWSAISETLLIDKHTGPGLSPRCIQAIYVIACMTSFCAGLPFGMLMDWCGPRFCNVTSSLSVAVGSLICSLANKSNRSACFMIGIVIIAFGGAGSQISVIHLTNLFPSAKGLITSIFTSCFNLSYMVFLLFSKVWETSSITFHEMFFTYSLLGFACAIVGGMLFPDKPFGSPKEGPQVLKSKRDARAFRWDSSPESAVQYYDSILANGQDKKPDRRVRSETLDDAFHVNLIRKPSTLNLKRVLLRRTYRRIPSIKFGGAKGVDALRKCTPDFDLKRSSLMDQCFSLPFLKMLLFFTIGTLWTSFHCGFIGRMLGDQNFMTFEELSFALQTFVMSCLFFGSISTPLFGMIADKYGYSLTVAVGLSCAIAYCICFLSKNIYLLYLGFALFPSYCSFQMVYLFAKLADDLGHRFYGILTGICLFIAGLVGLAQDYMANFASGTCHLETEVSSSCSEGSWNTLLLVELAIFSVMILVLPMMERKAEESKRPKKTQVTVAKPAKANIFDYRKNSQLSSPYHSVSDSYHRTGK